MTLYAAYGLVVMHVALGIMQYDRNPLIPAMLVGELRCGDAYCTSSPAGASVQAIAATAAGGDGWIAVGRAACDPGQGRAASSPRPAASASRCSATATQIGALTNLCAHQNGPIGEGRIIDGCVTCPWHG